MHNYHKMHLLPWLGVEYALACTQLLQLSHVPQVPHVVVVAAVVVVVVVVFVVVVIVVADVVLDSWIVLYERNKFSIENSYIVSSRTITWFYHMVPHTIEAI